MKKTSDYKERLIVRQEIENLGDRGNEIDGEPLEKIIKLFTFINNQSIADGYTDICLDFKWSGYEDFDLIVTGMGPEPDDIYNRRVAEEECRIKQAAAKKRKESETRAKQVKTDLEELARLKAIYEKN